MFCLNFKMQRMSALESFNYLHGLSLRFHINRKTGGVIRSIERGTTGISTLLRFLLFNIFPTLLEIVLVVSILLGIFNFWFALITAVSVVTYIAFTLLYTEYRKQFTKLQNDTNNETNNKWYGFIDLF